MTVTWRRSAPEETASGGDRTEGCSAGAARLTPCSPKLVREAPQSPQNFLPAGLSAPHAGHRCGSGAPQSSQKVLPSWIAAWHCGHCMLGPALITSSSILPDPDRYHELAATGPTPTSYGKRPLSAAGKRPELARSGRFQQLAERQNSTNRCRIRRPRCFHVGNDFPSRIRGRQQMGSF